jgi:hypothetical protein
MARPFLETFGQMRSGRLIEDCGAALAEIVQAVRKTGKAGEMTIKIKVKAPKGGAAPYLTVEDSLAVKVPKLDQADTVFFHTSDGGLSRQDPSQLEMQLRPVPQPIQPDRVIAVNTNPQTGETTEVIGRP